MSAHRKPLRLAPGVIEVYRRPTLPRRLAALVRRLIAWVQP